MTISSGASSGSSQGTRSSRSEDDRDLQAQMERRRKRRKESNRESARRSRLRKQEHLDGLTSQIKQLRDQKHQLSMAQSMTSQNLVALQAQNTVLQTQKMELENRLGALTEIICYLNANTTTGTTNMTTASNACEILGANTWSHQPIDMYHPCF